MSEEIRTPDRRADLGVPDFEIGFNEVMVTDIEGLVDRMKLDEVLFACKQWACDESRELAAAGNTLDLGSLELRHAAVNVIDAGR